MIKWLTHHCKFIVHSTADGQQHRAVELFWTVCLVSGTSGTMLVSPHWPSRSALKGTPSAAPAAALWLPQSQTGSKQVVRKSVGTGRSKTIHCREGQSKVQHL